MPVTRNVIGPGLALCRDTISRARWIETSLSGAELESAPVLNKGTGFTHEERDTFGLTGLLPPRCVTMDEQKQRILPAVWALIRLVRRLLAERRAAPRDDLLTALSQAEEAGDRLSEDEQVAMVLLLLIAGHETTVNLLSSGTLALLQHPQQLAALRAGQVGIKGE